MATNNSVLLICRMPLYWRYSAHVAMVTDKCVVLVITERHRMRGTQSGTMSIKACLDLYSCKAIVLIPFAVENILLLNRFVRLFVRLSFVCVCFSVCLFICSSAPNREILPKMMDVPLMDMMIPCAK